MIIRVLASEHEDMDLKTLGLMLIGMSDKQTGKPDDAPGGTPSSKEAPPTGPAEPHRASAPANFEEAKARIAELEKQLGEVKDKPRFDAKQIEALKTLGIQVPEQQTQQPPQPVQPVIISLDGGAGAPAGASNPLSMDDIKKMSVADINKNWKNVCATLESQNAH